MNPGSAPSQAMECSLRKMGERLLAEWAELSDTRLPDAPGLLICHREALRPDLAKMQEGSTALPLQLKTGSHRSDLEWGGAAVARTDNGSLPLQSSSLGAVMLCHVISRGEEAELAEACRVLQPGGCLFILGLNRIGFRYLGGRSSHGLPGMSPLAVRARLEQLEMNVHGLLATGFFSRERPRRMTRGPARMLVPVADLLLIVASPVEPGIINPLEKSKVRAVGAPSALAGQ